MKENIVKKTCKELGITQVQLAKELGLHIDKITNWSRGGSQEIATVIINLYKQNRYLKEKQKIVDSFLNLK